MDKEPKQIEYGVLEGVKSYLPESSGLIELQSKIVSHVNAASDPADHISCKNLQLYDAVGYMHLALEAFADRPDLAEFKVKDGKFNRAKVDNSLLLHQLYLLATSATVFPVYNGAQPENPLLYNDLVYLDFIRTFCLTVQQVEDLESGSKTPMEIFRTQINRLQTSPYSFELANFLTKIDDGRAVLQSAGFEVAYSQLTQREELVYKAVVQVNGVNHHILIIPNAAGRVFRRKQKTMHDRQSAVYVSDGSTNMGKQIFDFATRFPQNLVLDGQYTAKAVRKSFNTRIGSVVREKGNPHLYRRKPAL